MTPEIIAHRGASYLAPENTLSAFRKAMEIGADGVEMDVQQTSDKKLVIHHDFVIDWHTDMRGQIYDMTEGELKALDFGSWKDVNYRNERIATLQEALALCREMEGTIVQLEMKATIDDDPDFVPRVIEEVRAANITDRLVVISFNHDLLRQAKQLMPELKVGVLVYGWRPWRCPLAHGKCLACRTGWKRMIFHSCRRCRWKMWMTKTAAGPCAGWATRSVCCRRTFRARVW